MNNRNFKVRRACGEEALPLSEGEDGGQAGAKVAAVGRGAWMLQIAD
jgi:hypothetical protein